MIRCNIQEVLKERGWKVSELQRRTGIDERGLALIVSGEARRLDFASLDRICHALGVGVGAVLQHVPSPPPRRAKPKKKHHRPCGHVRRSPTCYDCLYPEDQRSDGPEPTVYRVSGPERE